jgi:CRISPR-associated protein Cmr1
MSLPQTRIKIKTLTPLWTGGVDATPDRLHETGIIGSLRWWYEAIVRGFGGYACDVTGENKCELSGKEKSNAERLQKLCPACYLFGCGGWKRGFRLQATNNGECSPFQLATLNKKGEYNFWWLSQIFEKAFGTSLPFSEVTLDFKQVRSDGEIKQLKALLSIMAHIGAIGAKNQYGFGQFDWEEKIGLKEAIDTIQKFLKDNNFKQGSNKAEGYSLDKFWFYELKLSSQNELVKRFQKASVVGNGTLSQDYLPVSFDIRYKLPNSKNNGLRQAYYLKHRDKRKTREVFGTLVSDKIGSRVFVCHLFKKDRADNDYWLRVWGFTESSIGIEVGEELKKMFAFKELPMIRGKEIINLGGTK